MSFILFCMSEVKLLARGGVGPGRLAAFIAPRGEEEVDMVGAAMLPDGRNDGALDVSMSVPSCLFGDDDSVASGDAGSDDKGSEFEKFEYCT